MQAKRGLRPPVYVDTHKAMDKLVDSLLNQSMIAVDTEANPLFAYREKLCLVQISTKSRDYLIDPLSEIDLSALVPVFADPSIVKIFHDAEFDVLMLKRTLPIEVIGIFDTKVAATSLGLETVGLAPILKAFFDVTLDKKYQRSDWGRRPLTDGQLDYARYDTHFLIALAEDLRERLLQAGEVHQLEVASEFRRVEQLVPEARPFNPDDFVKVKGWDRLDPTRRRVLRELFVMRHEIADDIDRPAFKVLPNDVLFALARANPESAEDLASSRVLSNKLLDRYGESVFSAISRGRRLSPLPDGKIHRTKSEQDRLSDEQKGTYETLRNWRKKAALRRGVDASLVVPRSMLFALCRLRHRPRSLEALREAGVLEPWRIDYYGEGIVEAFASGGAPSRNDSRRTGKAGKSRQTERARRNDAKDADEAAPAAKAGRSAKAEPAEENRPRPRRRRRRTPPDGSA